jgi:hypothetical protein
MIGMPDPLTASGSSVGLVFVEDPGAVNCVVPICQSLAADGREPRLFAAGHALPLLRARGMTVTPVDSLDIVCAELEAECLDWLLVGTSENLDSVAFALTAAADEVQVPSVAIIDSAANAANRFRGRSHQALTHAPQWLMVPDQWTADEFVALGYPMDRIGVVGHPHYDHLSQVGRQRAEIGREAIRRRVLPPEAWNRQVVVFASELSTGLDPAQYLRSAQYTLTGNGHSVGRTEIVIEEFLVGIEALTAARGSGRPYLLLRYHPKQAAGDLSEHAWRFDGTSIGGDVLDLLLAADLVVGMTSMLLLEAHLLGTPVVSILPRECERSWLPILRTGTVPVATNSSAVSSALREALCTERAVCDGSVIPKQAIGAINSTQRAINMLDTVGRRHSLGVGA